MSLDHNKENHRDASQEGSRQNGFIRELAETHQAVSQIEIGYPLLENLESQRDIFRQAQQIFISRERDEKTLASQTAEWVLDNYYIVQQAFRQVEEDLPKEYYRQLPKLRAGIWRGYPRVYVVARVFIDLHQASFSTESFQDFLTTYQEEQPLKIGELWALPTMLRIGLLETLIHSVSAKVDLDSPINQPPIEITEQVKTSTLVGNCILGLRAVSNQNWKDFFEEVSLVEQILGEDPMGVYSEMDFSTRDRYRKEIEQLSRATGYSELEIAREVLDMAVQPSAEMKQDKPAAIGHVGYYLIDRGREDLESRLNYRSGVLKRLFLWLRRKYPALLYLGSIGITALVFLIVVLFVAGMYGAGAGELGLIAVLVSIPALTVSNNLIRSLVPVLITPQRLPKLDFSEGVPENSQTIVVIPALITNQSNIESLLNQVELHYLRNEDDQIRFALLTDYADAPNKQMPGDPALLEQISNGIDTLNKTYPKQPFYLFHRKRIWNPKENVWMGWERKRGKLEEFNRWLGGEQERTSFTTVEGKDPSILPRARYVITLDSDTELPRGAAARLIGTMAHPLNHPRFDPETGRVITGYTILQPRVEIKPAGANKSRFAQIYSAHSTLDLYSHAVSDVYQDLFGEGIFTGKGIYDIEAFTRSLQDRVPENALLSHDLFEGIHGRAGLASDIVIYEDYPSEYLSFSWRKHRWIRGDWQLLPWLGRRVRLRGGESTPNPLPILSRWKIFDNLRRSLLEPVLLLILIAGWLWLPGPPIFWTIIGLIAPAGSMLSSLLIAFMDGVRNGTDSSIRLSFFRNPFLRWILFFVFLPYQAYISINAVITVLIRLWITRRGLLQWTTAAQLESRFEGKNNLYRVWSRMFAFSIGAIGLGFLIYRANPAALLAAAPFLLSWIFSPQIADWISRPQELPEIELTSNQIQELRRIARTTWLFFEQFVGPEDNWLPPDHFQEDPRGLVAHRTSPSNIGLWLNSALAAFDFGFIGMVDLSVRLKNSFQSLAELDKYRGHFCNWYDTRTKKPLPPPYVSTVDSGNLAACLLVLRQGCLSIPNVLLPRWERWQGLVDTLDMLGESLSDASRHMPDLVEAIEGQINKIRKDILSSEQNPDQWGMILENTVETEWPKLESSILRLLEETSLSPHELRRIRIWVMRSQTNLFDMHQRFMAMMPWVLEFENKPQFFLEQNEHSDIHQAFLEIEEFFPTKIRVGEIIEVCLDGRDRIRKMKERLEAIDEGTEDINQAIEWCEQFNQKLNTTIASASEMLDTFDDIQHQSMEMVQEMGFEFLYDPRRDIFRIGYNIESERPDPNSYDLLASEARIASMIAIAKGEAPQVHWLTLGRPLTNINGDKTLISWSGTMFEYLMPILWIRHYRDTLLGESIKGAVKAQMEYPRQEGLPWGVSESGYYRFDRAMNYQYRAFGAPSLGLKRGLEKDKVITPYASILALPLFPDEVFKNLSKLREYGMFGVYGFYEAADFTADRLALGQDYAIVRSYMIHHQAMIFLSLANILKEDIMVERFHADPRVQSVELLLQEQIPKQAALEQMREIESEEMRPEKREVIAKPWSVPKETPFPHVHLLSNGKYSSILTNSGGGFSRWQDVDLTRWRADTTRDDWGSWMYVQDLDKEKIWSVGTNPIPGKEVDRTVTFFPHKVNIRCNTKELAITQEVIVPNDDDLEIRRLTVTNQSGDTRRLRLTSYGEILLGNQEADRRHPAFNKMFIETEYLENYQAILFSRRPRSSEETSPYAAHLAVVEPGVDWACGYETDREAFLGRGGSVRSPKALTNQKKGGYSGTTGAVLDPVMSCGVEIEIQPHSVVSLAFLTIAGENRRTVIETMEKYQNWRVVQNAFRLVRMRSEKEMRQLALESEDVQRCQQLLSLLIYPHQALRADPEVLTKNTKGQTSLWQFAISGDYPILLLKVGDEDELGIVREIIKAHIYWRSKGLKIDVVLVNQQPGGYNQELTNQLIRLVNRMNSDSWLDRRGGIFILKQDSMDDQDQVLIESAARVVLSGAKGTLAAQLSQIESAPRGLPNIVRERAAEDIAGSETEHLQKLRHENGWGGFSENGSEYVTLLAPGDVTPAPWVNVIANQNFGFLVSESGAGFSWCENSGENRLTPWRNDPVCDPSGEVLYLRDEETTEVWSPTPRPAGAETDHKITHGHGYSIFESDSHGLRQKVKMFIDPREPVKLVKVELANTLDRPRRITATYYLEWVLGVNRDNMQQYILPDFDHDTQALLAKNPYSPEFSQQVGFLAASKEPHGFTMDRTEFIGRLGSLEDPAGLRRVGLSGRLNPGLDPCAALMVHLDFNPGETKEVHFLIGQGSDRQEALQFVRKFQQPDAAETSWLESRDQWRQTLDTIRVDTPDDAMNTILNSWLAYQTLSCRVWGRSAFYQSGGAYGFRDQLQDVVSVIHHAPDVARNHILRAARHQFVEGDVLHWWHPPSGRGVRTRITDDLLWLPWAAAYYVKVTGDDAILEEEIAFRTGAPLAEDEHERYGHYDLTEEKRTLYEHCCRAIEQGTTEGPHGLPLIGAGDWNDGMNRVGIHGKGESIWLGWFLYSVLQDFMPLCEMMDDLDRAEQYQSELTRLQTALSENAWDGEWYLRAFYDDGSPLGSSSNTECQIDAIAQSWSVLSRAGEGERARQAIKAVDQKLIWDDDRLMLLFAPPFDKTKNDPGYIKGYPPGIRENGGQYTHAAVWTAWAFAALGDGDRAGELFRLLNPILHTDSREKTLKYRTEPYVTAADIYSVPPHLGRGGWTWYTGSGGWLYRLGLEALLGFNREGDELYIRPCIPHDWESYSLVYRFGETEYHIAVENPDGVNQGVVQVSLDGEPLPDLAIPLKDDGIRHHVIVRMGENGNAREDVG